MSEISGAEVPSIVATKVIDSGEKKGSKKYRSNSSVQEWVIIPGQPIR
jgi:hypothetical protein